MLLVAGTSFAVWRYLNQPTKQVFVNSQNTTPAPPSNTPAPSSGSAQSTPSVSEAAGSSFTRADIATHNTETNCWIIVGQNVYDVTTFISQHPGGNQNIINQCGRDATADFSQQHAGQSTPAMDLAALKIGTVQ